MRKRLEGRRAVHAPAPQQLRRAHWLTESTHPVVRTDPETGRRSLCVTPGFTRRFEGRTAAESRPDLGALFRAALDPSVVYGHQWRAGDLVVWDNRALLHRAHR